MYVHVMTLYPIQCLATSQKQNELGREILIVQRPITPRHAVQKLMTIALKQACSR